MPKTLDYGYTDAVVCKWVGCHISVCDLLLPDDLAWWASRVTEVKLMGLSLLFAVKVLEAELTYVYVACERIGRPVRSKDLPRAKVQQALLVLSLEHLLMCHEHFLVNQLKLPVVFEVL